MELMTAATRRQRVVVTRNEWIGRFVMISFRGLIRARYNLAHPGLATNVPAGESHELLGFTVSYRGTSHPDKFGLSE